MKNMWKKRLSALMMTAVMLVGMIPGAAAACSHNSWSDWSKLDDRQHQRTCLTSGCVEVETANHAWSSNYTTDADSHWKVCTVCEAQTAMEGHTWSTAFSRDSENHWNACTSCGAKANLGGHVDLDSDAKCDTCGTDVSSSYITVTFKNGSSTYKTQSNLRKGSAPSYPGTPMRPGNDSEEYIFKGWTTTNPGSSALYTGQAYLTSTEVATTALTVSTTYYALYTRAFDATIELNVDAGDEVMFSRTDFKDVFDAEFGGEDTFRSVAFATDSSYKTAYGAVYYNYGKSGEEKFTADDLDLGDYYYSSSSYGDYPINSLSYVAEEDAPSHTVTIEFRAYGDDEHVDGTLEIHVDGNGYGSGSVSDTGVEIEVKAGESVDLNRTDFKEIFDAEFDGDDTFRFMTFETDSSYKSSNGFMWYNYDATGAMKLAAGGLESYDFYYNSSSYGDYPINSLTFVAHKDAAGESVTMEVRLWGDDDYVDAELEIAIVGEKDDDEADITYGVESGKATAFSVSDFEKVYKAVYPSGTMRYVSFDVDGSVSTSEGRFYVDYEGDDELRLTQSALEKYDFYTASSSYGEYDLDDLSFVAGDDFEDPITVNFTIYGASGRDVDGTLVLSLEESGKVTGTGADIIYYSTYSTNVQINANEIARFFQKTYPGYSLQYVEIKGVPTTGSLYYNYYNASKYGAKQTKLTASNCAGKRFYYSPSSTSSSALSELTYIPSGLNYCASIPFTAYGSGGRSVSGTILISVSYAAAAEVYGATPKGATVSFPVSAITSAMKAATGGTVTPASIRLLRLPDAKVGTVKLDGSTAKVDTKTLYSLTSTGTKASQLRFTAAAGYTGAVEIPYVAYSSSGNPIAAGKFCLGVVGAVKKFSDVTASTWCYKYVVELADAKVIDGYTDGSFRPNNAVTYGQALKLIMLAAGYSVQAPTDANVFSGYLAKAKADGLISGTVNLNQPISRLAVAQIAAKAMKLDVTTLSDVKPFTDTADVYVQALNAAGVVEGYFSNGTSTYKPANTLTRGQISAIVWRMLQYKA